MHPLRIRLYEITELRYESWESKAKLITQLKESHPHTIQEVASTVPIDRYTCVMHAFGIENDPDYIRIAQAAPAYVFASPTFAQRLILNGALKESPEPYAEALAAYFDHGRVTHIGRLVTPQRVESKWGNGILCHHALMEVPANYGSEIRYFRHIDKEDVLDQYANYARKHGVKFA